MPLITTKFSLSDGHILIWRLEETIEDLKNKLPDWLDFTEYHRISHPLKKREWLAGRHLFAALCKRAGITFQGIWKNPDGKPFLIGSAAHISLSHSEHFVAAALHYHSPVGIDLERPKEQLGRVASKFLSESELRQVNGNPDLLCRYWSAKEAVFKLFGEKKVSLRQHIRIIPPWNLPEQWTAQLTSPAVSGWAGLTFEKVDEYYLSVALYLQQSSENAPPS